ncbi:MAG TPA: carbohydrate ABC transporter permease [Chloroflexia bacterium]|nr:carbohydrate ABC transporter permease [Chloroflexia bacterium]
MTRHERADMSYLERRRGISLRRLAWHAIAIFTTLLFLLPLASMFVGSLRKAGLPPPRGIEWLPNPISWDNYAQVFQLVPMGRYMVNTLVVELMAVPVTLLVASWAGFALSQLPARFSRRVITAALLMLLLPETALWVSRFIEYRLTNLLNTPFALTATSIFGTSPLFTLIFYWTFRRVPNETWEAARVDGAGAFRTWWSLGVPAGRAAFAAVGVLTFVYYWREFREPLLYIRDLDKYTLSVGLAYLEQLDRTNLPILMAGSVIVTIPILVIFMVAQPFFLEPVERKGVPKAEGKPQT